MKYVNYGCGLSAPPGWLNYDASPTLKLQRMPVIGTLLRPKLNVVFPDNIMFGDIVAGLPLPENSCDGVYSSHVLEHLALNDFRSALKNTYKVLKPGGIFRCIVPDFELATREYIERLDKGEGDEASIRYLTLVQTCVPERVTGVKGMVYNTFSQAKHLWMWDKYSLAAELKKAGFKDIRNCKFNDSEDPMFKTVELEGRFDYAVAIECKK